MKDQLAIEVALAPAVAFNRLCAAVSHRGTLKHSDEATMSVVGKVRYGLNPVTLTVTVSEGSSPDTALLDIRTKAQDGTGVASREVVSRVLESLDRVDPGGIDGGIDASGVLGKGRRAWARRQSDKQAQLDSESERFGDLRASHYFGGYRVEVRALGFVSVVPALHRSHYERLISIDFDSDLFKKTGLGRGVAAVMTQGLNLLGSNKRGDVYLTIVTSERTHALTVDTPTDAAIRAGRTLAAVGNSTLGQLAAPEMPTAGHGLRDRLAELEVLLTDGLIDKDEHAILRARALDQST